LLLPCDYCVFSDAFTMRLFRIESNYCFVGREDILSFGIDTKYCNGLVFHNTHTFKVTLNPVNSSLVSVREQERQCTNNVTLRRVC
jgi:hypothetical protein